MSGVFALEWDDLQQAANQLYGAQSKWALHLRNAGHDFGVDDVPW